MKARIWAARACIAAAAALLRSIETRPPEPAPLDEDDESPIPPVAMTGEARRMIADGEWWASMILEKQLADKRREPEKPLRGSARARLEEAKARRSP